ncbi:MAG TPA: hypothetical protein VFR48_09405 [Solirubrobacteraceae bacterium]|nr:hypothetical protein [Solirubrobacteraceae bacterium]
MTLTVELPPGVTLNSYRLDFGTFNGTDTQWECPGAPGDSTFTCTTTTPIEAGADARNLLLTVNVAPDTGPNVVVRAQVSGGGSPEAPPAAECPSGVGACASESIHVSEELSQFGIVEDSWIADFYESDEVTPVRQAGSHPDLATFSFDVNSNEYGEETGGGKEKSPAGSLRNVEVDLPPGFLGNPTAVGECTPVELQKTGEKLGECPRSSQIGRVDVSTLYGGFGTKRLDLTSPLFNMIHSKGSVTDLGFMLKGKIVHIEASLDPANNYAIHTITPDINETLRVFNTRVTIWGIPGDPSHEVERGGPTGIISKPFLTVPDRCEGSNQMVLSHYDSWQESGVFGPPVVYEMPGQFTGCNVPRFEPEIVVEPTEKQADAPTGLRVNIHTPQNENPYGVATPPVKTTVVTLPEGMSFSPSFANGLTSCPMAEMNLGTNNPVECEDSSRIGEVTLSTPLLPKPLEGSIYLAAQYDNPFGSLFAMYLVLHDNEERGILVKLAGKIEADPITGRITTTFANTPQLPFDDLTLRFRSGDRAPLVNPAFCGAQTVTGTMASWAQPNNPAPISTTYQIAEGPNGAPCPAGGALAFNPGLVAGTADNVAGSHSPLDLRLMRNDGEQEITGFGSNLPPGLTASLTGVPFCSETAIAAAESKTGAQEEAEPSCPAASQIGHTIAEAGVGGTLAQAPGKLYMGGPYQGAPFSIISITSAKVGPFDLGTVVVHLPLSIDLHTANVTVGSGEPDQIPHIIKGVIVHLRNIRVYVDRPNFVLNPTSCEHLTFSATIVGSGQNYVSPTDDVPVTVSNQFQAADCSSLRFTPSFKVSAGAKSSRTQGENVKFNIAYPHDPIGTQSWFHAAKFTIPRQLPARLTTLQQACAAATFERNPAACPTHSNIGRAVVHTPILPVPLEGPIYFVSHGGEKFPDVVLVLQGYGITVDLTGQTFISKAGVTSATFHNTPDVPFESIEVNLPSGPYSEFGANLPHNSQSFCGQKLVVPTAFTASNGLEIHQNTPVNITNCPKSITTQQKLNRALAACHHKHGKKRTSCERTARKRYPATKANTKKRK